MYVIYTHSQALVYAHLKKTIAAKECFSHCLSLLRNCMWSALYRSRFLGAHICKVAPVFCFVKRLRQSSVVALLPYPTIGIRVCLLTPKQTLWLNSCSAPLFQKGLKTWGHCRFNWQIGANPSFLPVLDHFGERSEKADGDKGRIQLGLDP